MTELNGFRGKRVLLTGHTGFKGAWLTQWLLDLGAEVAGFSDGIPTQPSLFEVLSLSPQIRDYRGDVRDASALQACFSDFRPEVVFHLAAQSLVRASYQDPISTFATNVMGTANLLQAARSSGDLRVLVNVTSDKCYENQERAEPYGEDDRMGGRDPYSASKGCAELVFSSFARSFFMEVPGAPVVVSARSGNVIGGGDWSADRLVVDCVKRWSEGRPVVLRNPASTRPWQHVLDCLSGYLVLADRAQKDPSRYMGQGFNFGPSPGRAATVQEMVKQFAAHWPQAAWSVSPDSGSEPREAHLLQLNCDKARQLLGWTPSWGIDHAVKATSEWYQDFYSGNDVRKRTRDQIREYQSSL